MLVLSRKLGEEIVIGDNVRLKVVAIQGNLVRLGFTAPRDISIFRQELVPGVITPLEGQSVGLAEVTGPGL